MDFERKLRIKIRKALAKSFVTNARLGPPTDVHLTKSLEAGERPVAVVDSKSGIRYWFTDRRALLQNDAYVAELFRYEAVQAAHCMFKDPLRRMLESGDEPGSAVTLKSKHYDRIVVEATSGEFVLEGLGQSSHALLQFLWWFSRNRQPISAKS